MYCFQCGEELVKGAKFCHVCGANQEEAKKLFEKNFKNSSPDLSFESSKGSSGDTKVAYSSDPEDGEYLKSYMNKVDTQVGESIKKHETLTGIKKQEAKDKKAEERIEAKKQKESLKNKETIEPRDAFEPKSVKEPKKKKSFSSIWKNFIDEEDNPYSVFGEMADRLEHEEAALSSDEEDNLRISQDVEDDRFAQTGDVSTLNKKVNEILDAQEENEGKEKITPKGVLSSFFSRDKKEDDTIAHEAFVASAEKEAPETEDEELHSKSDDSDYMVIDFTRSSDGEDVIVPQDAHETAFQSMETTSELEDKPRASRSSFLKNFKRKSENLKRTKREKKKATNEEPPKQGEKHHKDRLGELLEKTDSASKFEMARNRVLSKGEQGLRGLFGIGILLSALPVFFAFRRIGILPILFVLLKIFITLFTFYFANNVARRNTCRQDNLKARTVDNLLMWVLYLIPVTVIFFILPSSFAMGRTVLGSVTPHILLSIFMYAWVIFLALSAAQEILPKKNTFEFMAWYGIIFISFDLLAKLFWIIMNILTSTFA